MRRRDALALLASALVKGEDSKPFVWFTDVAAQAGLTEPTIYGGVTSKKYIIETNGCGVAVIDFDNDGWPDLFLPGGSRLDRAPAFSNRLYKNNRDGTFKDVTKGSGLDVVNWASGVCVGDFDNDGLDDIFLACWGRNYLFKNNGDGTFRDVTKEAGLLTDQGRWSAGCTWIDYNRDGWLDLFVSEYLEFDLRTAPLPGAAENCSWKGVAVNCGPKGLPTGRNRLYRSNGRNKAGLVTFQDVSDESGIAKVRNRYGMTAVAADFDDDGWPDIFVACDSTPSVLYRNGHDGTFEDVGLTSGVAYNEDGREQAGMGVAVSDSNHSGRLDLFKTHFADDTPIYLSNKGDGIFEDQTTRSGAGGFNRYVGWGTAFADFDNDGWDDLLWVNGNVYPEIEKYFEQYKHANPRILLRNRGRGLFTDVSHESGPGISAVHSSRGCAVADFDNDGYLEIVVMNMNEPPSLLKNSAKNGHHWLRAKLIGTKSNRSAIGASATLKTGEMKQRRDVLSQSSFYSQSDLRLHFGMGVAQQGDLEVRWPSGLREVFPLLAANQTHTLREGQGKAVR